MTAIAKVFIVLNFVLSVFFVGVASTLLYKADNYRLRFETEQTSHRKTQADRKADVDKLTAELNTAQTSVDSATRARQDLERERDSLKSEKAALENTRAQLQNTVAGFEASLKDLQSNLKAASETNEQLKRQTDEAVAARNDAADKQAEAEAEVVRKEDALKDAAAQMESLEKQIAENGENIARLENVIAMAKDRGVDLEAIMAPPPINGTIVRVDSKINFCVISVGADDGVKPGYPFHIYRGQNFVGMGVVEEVFQDLAAMKITRVARGMEVMTNDQVTTRL